MASARERRAALRGRTDGAFVPAIFIGQPATAEETAHGNATYGPKHSEGSSDGRAAVTVDGKPAAAGSTPAPPTIHLFDGEPVSEHGFIHRPEEPMKIQFTHINLHKAIDRMNAGKGHWSATSTRHNASETCSIELDTATQLVRISNGTACTYVPREGVENFGPTLEDAAAHAATLKAIAVAVAKANEEAIAATAETAATPA